MAHDQNFDEFSQPKKSNTGKFILVGCLSVVIAVMLLLGVAGVIIWQNGRTWIADGTTAVFDKAFQEIHLPAEEHAALMQRVELLATEFKDGSMSIDEFKQLGSALSNSDLLPMLITKAMTGTYIAPSSLSDEDKARGELAFGRLARGFVDDKLVDSDFEAVFKPISKNDISITINSNGSQSNTDMDIKPPHEVTTEELLEVIANAEKLAEEKGLDPEPLDVDVVEELDQLIEETLGRKLEAGTD